MDWKAFCKKHNIGLYGNVSDDGLWFEKYAEKDLKKQFRDKIKMWNSIAFIEELDLTPMSDDEGQYMGMEVKRFRIKNYWFGGWVNVQRLDEYIEDLMEDLSWVDANMHVTLQGGGKTK